MRTRFLNTDYFSTSPTETLNFLNLPPPHLPPSHLPIFNDDLLLHFDPLLNVPLQNERLPIDAALSKFLSEAIPQSIYVDFRDFEDIRSPIENVGVRFSEKKAMVCHDENEAGSQITIGSEILEKDNVTTEDDKDVKRFEVVLFETPELDTFLENARVFEKRMETFCGIPEIDNNQDETDPVLQFSKKIQESVYSVEDATSEIMEQNNYMLEEDCSFGDRTLLQDSSIPLLEVDEISLGIMTSHSMDDVLYNVFEYIESQLWIQENNMLIDSKELLDSTGYNTLKFLSDHCLSEQFPKPELSFPEMFLDLNLICMVETPQVDGISDFYMVRHDADYCLPMDLIIFEEFQIFDVDSSQNFEVFLNRQVTHEPEACNQMFMEDMNLKNFNALVVSNELPMVDETFKSLPVPLLSDYRRMRLTCMVAEELLSELKPLPLAASADIYLDWYILEEDKSNNKVYSLFQNMVEEMDSNNIDFDQETLDDGKLVFNFIFSDDTSSGSVTERYEEAVNVSLDSIPVLNSHLMAVASGSLQDNGCAKPGNSELAETDAKRVSLLCKSMPQFNDLETFLNPQKGSVRENTGHAVLSFDPNATLLDVSSGQSVEASACPSSGVQLQQWDIMVYSVTLSDDILALIENFEKSYLAILQNETELISFLPVDNFELLSLPQKKFMECIKKKMARRMNSHKDEDIMAFITLCAIKQMAWYMCFYGIHAAHSYVDNLWRSLGCIKSRLSFLHTLVEDACGKIDKDITRSHPSLRVIRGILQPNTGPSSLKVLFVADQVLWWSLKSLLTSMGLSWNELSSFCTDANPDADKMDYQLISDCCLVSQEHVSTSFPLNKFNLIVEYGGFCDSSRVSSFSPKSVGLTRLHFLKIELDGSSASKALCEGVDLSQNTKKLMGGEFDSISTIDDNVNYEKLEYLLNFVPAVNKNNNRSLESVDKVEAHCMPPPVAEETELTQQTMIDMVIVVNMQNFDKEMIASRRSTYQKILAKEKEGAQVVERDLNLPVDVIISCAICLVWYDCRNIGQKAATLDEASSSCLPLCIEYIATNILTLLSFTFKGCFLVFEGENGFLSTVMESSAGLYAAAASLGIDFQLFCSDSSELTDGIILNCIDYAAKMTRGLYPKMPDSETLAESFLTKFPSINPLTAHAILSSGGKLIEFLEWSHERRIHAIQNYCVPDESVALFSALCKYGEREDSKSIMTDCSSVSSGPDSDKGHRNAGSEGKQRKCMNSPHKISTRMDEFQHFEPLNHYRDDFLNPSGLAKACDSWMSKGSEMFQDYKRHSSSVNDIFDQKQEFDFSIELSSQVKKQYDAHISEDLKMLNDAKKPKFNEPLSGNLFGYSRGKNMATLNGLDWQNIKSYENQKKDYVGEVIDLTDNPMSGEDFSSFCKSIYSLEPEIEEDSTRKCKSARRLSFGNGSDTVFPYISEVNTGSDTLSSLKYPKQSFRGANDDSDTGFKDKLPPSHQENLIREVLAQESVAFKGSLLKNEGPNHGETPLSKAIRSSHQHSGSPWTIEFLNRIREKSKLRQQSLPSDASASPYEIPGNIAKVRKRRSPSILEFFKYQGGSTPRKMPGQRKQKTNLQSSLSSKNEKTSSSLLQTGTPSDKRARQTLSFAMDDSGSQTKLVWSDGSAHGLSKKLRRQ